MLRLAVLGSEKMLHLKITIIFSNRLYFIYNYPAFFIFFLHQMKLKSCHELFTAKYSGAKHGVSSSSEAGCALLLQLVKVMLFLCIGRGCLSLKWLLNSFVM